MVKRSGDNTRHNGMGRPARRAAALAMSAVTLGFAASCDSPSADERALASARRAMAALHSGPDAPAADVQKAVQTEVVTTLRGVGERLPGATGASAWALLAQAQAGLAQLDAMQAASADARLLNIATQARSVADLYAAQHALAAALERHDPRAAITDLDQQARALEGEMSKAQAARQREVERLEKLKAAAAEETRLAKEQRVAELSRRATASQAAPAERAAGYEDAHTIARTAATHEKKAAEIEAEAALVKPLIGVHDLDIARITTQRELIGASKAQIEQAAKESGLQAVESREDARAASEALAGRLEELDALLTGESTAKHEAAASGFASAVASARNAVKNVGTGEAKLGASVALAGYLQSLGDLRGSHAQTLGAMTALVATVKGVTPPVGDAAALEASLARLAELRAKADEAAAQAYDGARAALNGSGAKGETAEKIKALQALLPGAPKAEAPVPAPEGTAVPPEGGAPTEEPPPAAQEPAPENAEPPPPPPAQPAPGA